MSLSGMISILNAQRDRANQQLREKCLEIWSGRGHLDRDLLKEFAFSGPFASSLLKEHPFYPVQDSITQVEYVFGMLANARDNMIDKFGAFHYQAVYGGIPDIRKVSDELTESLFHFAFCALSLVQCYRHFTSAAPKVDAAYITLREQIFDHPGLGTFIRKLRNCFGHERILVVEPTLLIENNETREVLSAVKFNRAELLSMKGVWNKEARDYIEKEDDLDVMRIMNEYYNRASKLFQCYLAEIGITQSEEYMEFARCEEAIASISNLVALNLALQMVKHKSENPYKYLHNYFSAAEIRRVSCFQPNTREQVDFMISLRDPLGFCEDDTREGLYDLFACKSG